jgi:GT2 family glycosyltransferase
MGTKSMKIDSADVIPIVLTYNNVLDTIECINSLNRQTLCPRKILLVDNASTDGTPGIIRQLFPQVKIIESKVNRGVPAGYNLGIKEALIYKPDYLLILNNDTVFETSALESMVKSSVDNHRAAIILPQIRYYSALHKQTISRKDIWTDGSYYRKFPPSVVLKDNRNIFNQYQTHKVEFAAACVLLINPIVFERIGYFDENIFFLFEDWDFSKRVIDSGLEIWTDPNAIVWHKVSKSIGKDMSKYWYMMGRSGVIFTRKHYSSLVGKFQIAYYLLRDFLGKPKNLKYLINYLAGINAGRKLEMRIKQMDNNYHV